MVWLRTSLNVTAAPPRAGSLHGMHPPPIIPEHQRRLHARSVPCLVFPAELPQEKEIMTPVVERCRDLARVSDPAQTRRK
jgi:hypothetical protein